MKKIFSLGLHLAAAILPLTLSTPVLLAQTASYSVIADFGTPISAGYWPRSPLVFDPAGNIFGVDQTGVPVIFELSPTASGKWTKRAIVISGPGEFDDYDRLLVADSAGNLYGSSVGNYLRPHGAVFELSPSSNGTWTRTELYRFKGPPDAIHPGPVVMDKMGNLYGVSANGGQYGDVNSSGGAIFELSRGSDGKWTETVLYSFDNSSGTHSPGLTLDEAGDLYGIDNNNSDASCVAGVAFRLKMPQVEGGNWVYTILHSFPGLDTEGKNPSGDAACPSNVIFDTKGNLFGTSEFGGAYNHGSVFEIPAGGEANGPDKILYSFHIADFGALNPYGGLTIDPSGNLYGTASAGGHYNSKPDKGYKNGGGKIFELSPQDDGSWTMKALHDFGGQYSHGIKGADGWYPLAGLTIGPDGNFYGTTTYGGHHPGQTDKYGYGTVFKVVVQ